MISDHHIGGGWGDHIQWLGNDQFQERPLNAGTFSVWGHKPRIPEVGETLLAEFTKSHVQFRFVEVERCRDPKDLFFAEVGVCAIQEKGTNTVLNVKWRRPFWGRIKRLLGGNNHG